MQMWIYCCMLEVSTFCRMEVRRKFGEPDTEENSCSSKRLPKRRRYICKLIEKTGGGRWGSRKVMFQEWKQPDGPNGERSRLA